MQQCKCDNRKLKKNWKKYYIIKHVMFLHGYKPSTYDTCGCVNVNVLLKDVLLIIP